MLFRSVTFVRNHGMTPPGTGDVPALIVAQAPDVGGTTTTPVVHEVAKGSVGLGGEFEIDFFSPDGARKVSFDETAERMKAKLEEMSTIGAVHVTREEYPSSVSGGGGWGWAPVAVDGTPGGYKWTVRFVKNPGTSSGYTFPPGSGNVDPITITSTGLTGDGSKAENQGVTAGSSALSGHFTLSYGGASTGLLSFEESAENMDSMIDELSTIGDMSVEGGFRAMQAIAGVTATVERDGRVAIISGGDLRDHLAPGQIFRIGGGATGDVGLYGGGDGSLLVETVQTTVGSPLVTTTTELETTIAPGSRVHIGGDEYLVNRTGVEVQSIIVHAQNTTRLGQSTYANAYTLPMAATTDGTTAITFAADVITTTLAPGDKLQIEGSTVVHEYEKIGRASCRERV